MGRTAQLSLLDWFQTIRDAENILLTTYTFDPQFFDNILLPRLLKNNDESTITLFCDAGKFLGALENKTNVTGKKYNLIPIPMRGAFHPKVFLADMGDGSGDVLVGSHNLTLPGMGSNLETTYRSNDHQFVEDVRAFFIQLINRLDIPDEVAPRLKEPSSKASSGPHGGAPQFIHNLERPIEHQLRDILADYDFSDLRVLSPYHGSVQNLCERFQFYGISEVSFYLQEEAHTLDALPTIPELATTAFELTDVDRRLHSKLLEFHGRNLAIFLGSPNFTSSALCESGSTDGSGKNIEAGVLLVNPPQDILGELNTVQVDGELPNRDPDADWSSRGKSPSVLPLYALQTPSGVKIRLHVHRRTEVRILLSSPNGQEKMVECQVGHEPRWEQDIPWEEDIAEVEVIYEDESLSLPVVPLAKDAKSRWIDSQAQDAIGFRKVLTNLADDEDVVTLLHTIFSQEDDNDPKKKTASDGSTTTEESEISGSKMRSSSSTMTDDIKAMIIRLFQEHEKKRSNEEDDQEEEEGDQEDTGSPTDRPTNTSPPDDQAAPQTSKSIRPRELRKGFHRLSNWIQGKIQKDPDPAWLSNYFRLAHLIISRHSSDNPGVNSRFAIQALDGQHLQGQITQPDPEESQRLTAWIVLFAANAQEHTPFVDQIEEEALATAEDTLTSTLGSSDSALNSDQLWNIVSDESMEPLMVTKEQFKRTIDVLQAKILSRRAEGDKLAVVTTYAEGIVNARSDAEALEDFDRLKAWLREASAVPPDLTVKLEDLADGEERTFRGNLLDEILELVREN